jgi:CBS domain-containing protein
MIKKEIEDFLKKTPPFNMLGAELTGLTSEVVSIEFYPRGEKILIQNGPPCTSLRIIKKGGVKVYMTNSEGDDVVIDYRSEGDSFGYVSLISGDKSRASVMAIEDTICYLIPKNELLKMLNKEPLLGEYFMKSFFLNFIDKTYKEMRDRNIVFGEGDKLLFTTQVKDLLTKEPVTADSSVAVKDAAVIMSKHRISSLILMDKNNVPVGIITDRDLRDKVVARDFEMTKPVKEIMSPPLIRVDSHETCFEALVKMIQYNVHHLIVVEEGRLVGVVTNHDFMLLQGHSPLSIVKYIEGQKSVEGLLPVYEKINQIISILFKEGLNASYIIRIISELHDRLLQKIIDLSVKEIGGAPGTFSFAVFGSEGRKEQTFKTDFDCAIIYDQQYAPHTQNEMKEFSRKLLSHLQDIFGKSGLPRFNPHPIGDSFELYGELTEWEQVIIPALTAGDEKTAQNARKFLDLRVIYGDGMRVKSLKESIFSRIRTNRRFIALFLDWALNQVSPLGFFKQFVVDRSGEHKDELNIREKGILPIVDAIRVLAAAHNITETSTIERLRSLSRKGKLLQGLEGDIGSAFEFLLYLRLQDQMRRKEFHEKIDDFIAPEKLSLIEKKTLKEVFQLIPRLHSSVEDYFHRERAVAL